MTQSAILSLLGKLHASGVKNAVIGDLPAQQAICTAIRPVDGYPSTRFFGQHDLEEPLVEVLVRDVSYESGQKTYNLAKEALNKYSDKPNGILSSLLTGSPGFLGRNASNFCEWHMLFHVTIEE